MRMVPQSMVNIHHMRTLCMHINQSQTSARSCRHTHAMLLLLLRSSSASASRCMAYTASAIYHIDICASLRRRYKRARPRTCSRSLGRSRGFSCAICIHTAYIRCNLVCVRLVCVCVCVCALERAYKLHCRPLPPSQASADDDDVG